MGCCYAPVCITVYTLCMCPVEELDTLSDSLAASNEKYAARTSIRVKVNLGIKSGLQLRLHESNEIR